MLFVKQITFIYIQYIYIKIKMKIFMVYQAEVLVWKMLGDDFELHCIYGCVSWCDKLKLIKLVVESKCHQFQFVL